MALTAYCQLDEVRAALGCNDIELSDAVLSLPVYEIGLVRELSKVSESLPAAFSVVSSISEASRTAPQAALVDAVHLFSVYACARQVGVSLGVMAPKDIGDGKATLSRFSDSPYKEVMENVERWFLATATNLVDALATYSGSGLTSTVRTPAPMFLASSRASDPVTGV